MIVILVTSAGALIFFHLELLPEGYLISIILFLLAAHTLQEAVRGEEIRQDIKAFTKAISVPKIELELIKPAELIDRTAKFALKNRGEDWWFNTCANMFRSHELFDALLRPSIENQKTTKVAFIMRPSMKAIWEEYVQPQIETCRGKEKVQTPIWVEIDESISFRMIDLSADQERKEALLTFWGEPFMMEHTTSSHRAHMPRYVLLIKHHSELIHRLKDIFVKHKLQHSVGSPI
ncbi:MAG: hypothetical protein ACYC1U_02965 [Candidatus Aquicultorales bacterium]